MTDKKNLAASVRQRLLNLSRERKEPFTDTLLRFAVERLLYRLSLSPYSKRFLLKGSLLISLWNNNLPHRPTRDMDLHGIGSNELADIESIFRSLACLPVAEDGLMFDPDSIQTKRINETKAYQGVRVRMVAQLENARIPVQVDIGFGDAITPQPDTVQYTTLLPDLPAPLIRTYPIYTVLAEKIEAIVSLGEQNSRMKDFFDVHFLFLSTLDIDRAQLRTALQRTFAQRKTTFPVTTPESFTGEFAQRKEQDWKRFLNSSRLPNTGAAASFPYVIEQLRSLLSSLWGD